jgi:hypothetical protein
MKQCPACLPPHNASCSTCGGTNQVTEEVHSKFMIEKLERESTMEFARKIQEILYSNVSLGELTSSIKNIIKEYE